MSQVHADILEEARKMMFDLTLGIIGPNSSAADLHG